MAVLSGVGIVLLVAAVAWMFGSAIARGAGLTLVFAGLMVMISGLLSGLVFGTVGVVLWLLGHWLFAYKHHVWRSPLARRVYSTRLLGRIDPTRGWAVPTFSAEQNMPNPSPPTEPVYPPPGPF